MLTVISAFLTGSRTGPLVRFHLMVLGLDTHRAALGFEMTVQWYFRRIRKVIAYIAGATIDTLPANRKIIADFISSWQVRWVEDFLSGLRDVEQWDDTDWESDSMFLKFKDYIVENEQKIDRSLQGVKYVIDEANTLKIVAGDGRPEKVSVSSVCEVPKPLTVAWARRSTSCPLFCSSSNGACISSSKRKLPLCTWKNSRSSRAPSMSSLVPLKTGSRR